MWLVEEQEAKMTGDVGEEAAREEMCFDSAWGVFGGEFG